MEWLVYYLRPLHRFYWLVCCRVHEVMKNPDIGQMSGFTIILAAAFAVPLLAAAAFLPWQQVLEGPAVILDGDTLQVSGRRVRLLGLDAPELNQPCTPFTGEVFNCGVKARYELITFIGQRPVICKGRHKDVYGRLLAFCEVVGHDLGRFLITRGWAVTYGDDAYRYADDERMAKAERVGIWGTFFDRPVAWRGSRQN